jgi:hypothetical protein
LGFFKKKEKVYTGTVGGPPFFFSLLCLVILTLSSLWVILVNFGLLNKTPLLLFAATAAGGAWLSYVFVSGRLNVLIHEFKHSFVSSLVGNKAKKLKITSRETGHFEYSFTKDTAKYNALIALAPYFLPLFSFPMFMIGFGLSFKDVEVSPALFGLLYGMDVYLNVRDVGEHQTDFTSITGGYLVGISFVILMNLAILLIYLAWVGLGFEGLKLLILGLGEFLLLFIKKDIELP